MVFLLILKILTSHNYTGMESYILLGFLWGGIFWLVTMRGINEGFYKLDYPEFYTIKGDFIPEDDDYNYYRIITSKNKNLDKKENIEIIFSGNEVKKINRLGLGENWDLVEAMEKCVKLKKVGKDYLEFGKRFILEKESE